MGLATVSVNGSTMSDNRTGIYVNSANGVVRMNNATVVNNIRGLVYGPTGGQIVSMGNNAILGNPWGDGVPSSTISPQ